MKIWMIAVLVLVAIAVTALVVWLIMRLKTPVEEKTKIYRPGKQDDPAEFPGVEQTQRFPDNKR